MIRYTRLRRDTRCVFVKRSGLRVMSLAGAQNKFFGPAQGRKWTSSEIQKITPAHWYPPYAAQASIPFIPENSSSNAANQSAERDCTDNDGKSNNWVTCRDTNWDGPL